MNSIVIQSRSGPDSKLHLEIPVSQPDTEFEIEVVVRPKAATFELPPGYFNLIGAIDDETFVRPPQGELDAPVEFE